MGDSAQGSGEVEVPPEMAGLPASPEGSRASGGVPAAEVPLTDVDSHRQVRFIQRLTV